MNHSGAARWRKSVDRGHLQVGSQAANVIIFFKKKIFKWLSPRMSHLHKTDGLCVAMRLIGIRVGGIIP